MERVAAIGAWPVNRDVLMNKEVSEEKDVSTVSGV